MAAAGTERQEGPGAGRPGRRRSRRLPSPPGRLGRGEAIAAIAGVALLAATFLPWYGYEQTGRLLVLVELSGYPADAWRGLEVLPWLLAAVALAALAMAALALAGSRWRPLVPIAAAVAVSGGLATLAVLVRILFPPDMDGLARVPVQPTVEAGAFLGLAAAVGIACGGYSAMRAAGLSFGAVAERLGEGPEAPPATERRGRGRPAWRRRSRSSSD